MSSGERKRIDVAMILSLYEFTSHIKPNLPKFLILDEIFDSLDYPGVNAVIETLNDVQKRHQIDLYLISHISIPISYDNVKNILVSKKDKNSTVKFLE
jgi:energy-coupling factor transporter ATP-binding protein EcfA2